MSPRRADLCNRLQIFALELAHEAAQAGNTDEAERLRQSSADVRHIAAKVFNTTVASRVSDDEGAVKIH
jgi:hypothetical protein